jgi:hypothetical protein
MMHRIGFSAARLGGRALRPVTGAVKTGAQSSVCSAVARRSGAMPSIRTMATLGDVDDAEKAWKASCYYEMDFTISEDDTVYEAVQKFAAFDVGAFVTTDSSGMF